MRSPFPGMDPSIESAGRWPDFHTVFLTVCQEQLLDRLPPGYDALINESVKLVDLAVDDAPPTPGAWPGMSTVVRDVTVVRDPWSSTATAPAGGDGGPVATLEPLLLRTADYVNLPERWVEIRADPDAELVAVLEVLSPTNKRNPGFGESVAKRAALVRGGASVLEVDLLTKGMRPELVPPLPAADYAALLFRADRHPVCDAYVWGVRQPLPVLPVPLRRGERDVPIDLAAAMATAYERRRYGRSLRYDRALDVRLSPEDLRWAADVGTAAVAARTK